MTDILTRDADALHRALDGAGDQVQVFSDQLPGHLKLAGAQQRAGAAVLLAAGIGVGDAQAC